MTVERIVVLVVAVEPLARAALVRYLRGRCEVVEARTVDRALAKLGADASIACVVTDLDEESSSIDLLGHVQERYPTIGRVLIAQRVNRPIDAAIASGLIDWFIERPDVAREITQAVEVASMTRKEKP